MSTRTRRLLVASLLALLVDAIVRNVDHAWAAHPMAQWVLVRLPVAHFAFLGSAVVDWRGSRKSLSAPTQRVIAWMIVLYALSALMQVFLHTLQGG